MASADHALVDCASTSSRSFLISSSRAWDSSSLFWSLSPCELRVFALSRDCESRFFSSGGCFCTLAPSSRVRLVFCDFFSVGSSLVHSLTGCSWFTSVVVVVWGLFRWGDAVWGRSGAFVWGLFPLGDA